jgi:hypothetical protein
MARAAVQLLYCIQAVHAGHSECAYRQLCTPSETARSKQLDSPKNTNRQTNNTITHTLAAQQRHSLSTAVVSGWLTPPTNLSVEEKK